MEEILHHFGAQFALILCGVRFPPPTVGKRRNGKVIRNHYGGGGLTSHSGWLVRHRRSGEEHGTRFSFQFVATV